MPLFSLGDRKVELRGNHHFVAHDATLVGSIVLESDANVWFGVVIRADNDRVHIGEATNIQDGSVLHCDPGFPLTIGKRVTVGHKVMLHGCTVGDGALIGINSVILNGAKIGAGSLIGANSLVPEGKEIPAGVLAVGSPAKVVRELKPEEKAGILQVAESYVERSRLFKDQMKPQ
jgi:carbonic anhydrase/acetyltransferase-like protein (isoleucine patch superfamily)